MSCVGMGSSSVAVDDTEVRQYHHRMHEMEDSIKAFDGAIASTMTAYGSLLSALERVAEAFHGLSSSGGSGASVRERMADFREGMVNLRDRGGFVNFDAAIYAGTVQRLEPLKERLRQLGDDINALRAFQRDYNTSRDKVERMEGKSKTALANNTTYMKERERRDSAGTVYDSRKTRVRCGLDELQAEADTILTESLNNYLRSSSMFCSYLQNKMDSYRSDVADPKGDAQTYLGQMRADAERESVARRNRNIRRELTEEEERKCRAAQLWEEFGGVPEL